MGSRTQFARSGPLNCVLVKTKQFSNTKAPEPFRSRSFGSFDLRGCFFYVSPLSLPQDIIDDKLELVYVHVPTNHAIKHTEPILNTEKQGSVRRNRERNGLAKRAPSARASSIHFARWLAASRLSAWLFGAALQLEPDEIRRCSSAIFLSPCYGLSKTPTIFEIGDTRFFRWPPPGNFDPLYRSNQRR